MILILHSRGVPDTWRQMAERRRAHLCVHHHGESGWKVWYGGVHQVLPTVSTAQGGHLATVGHSSCYLQQNSLSVQVSTCM